MSSATDPGGVPGFISDCPLARGLILIGDEAVGRADDAQLRGYFAADYIFHGPGGDMGFDVTASESAQHRTSAI